MTDLTGGLSKRSELVIVVAIVIASCGPQKLKNESAVNEKSSTSIAKVSVSPKVADIVPIGFQGKFRTPAELLSPATNCESHSASGDGLIISGRHLWYRGEWEPVGSATMVRVHSHYALKVDTTWESGGEPGSREYFFALSEGGHRLTLSKWFEDMSGMLALPKNAKEASDIIDKMKTPKQIREFIRCPIAE